MAVYARSLAVATGALACCLAMTDGAVGSVALRSVVSANPADFTPNVVDGGGVGQTEIYALARSGQTIYAGGHFSVVQDASGEREFDRTNLVSFDANTGAVTSFAPEIDGEVLAVEPAGRFVFVGGRFTSVDGVPRRGIAKIDPVTGEVDPAFDPRLDGDVTQIRLVHSRLLVGGSFSRRLVALDPSSGADTRYIRTGITRTLGTRAGRVEVYRFAVNPAGTRLVAIGNFREVGRRARSRAFMLNLGARSTSLSAWHYPPLGNRCRAVKRPEYLRDVDFSPDGRYFVVVATGFVPLAGGIGRDICDAAARFETAVSNPRRPTWINYTGGDTLHSVAATGSAVYVQGHMRTVNRPLTAAGRRAGLNPADRVGIAALNPATGAARAWNPGKTRGIGGKAFLATSAGLWVGSDGARFAGELHDNIVFCPR